MRKLLVIVPVILFSLLAGGQALAMYPSDGSHNQCSRPAPYTGGAAVAQVFYPQDGSTVTVTQTGAVIKQSPCRTAYREGWVSTCNLGNMSYSQVVSQLRAGSSNPYTSSCGPSASSSPTTSTSGVSSNTNANYNYNYSYNSPAPAVQASAQAPTTTPTSSTESATVQMSAASGKAAPIPNTGPGEVLAVGGITTAIGTVGHFLFQAIRRR